MSTNATQPDQAEGEREDERIGDAPAGGQGRSSQAPAEGADDAPAGGAGSPG